MGTIIGASIDTSKLKKSMLAKDRYLNITILVNDSTDQYGNNCAVILTQSKEEREEKKDRTYFGNGKVIYTDGKLSVAGKDEQVKDKEPEFSADTEEDFELPF